MDRELPDEDRQRIRAIATAHPEVIRLHDLRTRSSGPQIFIQFDLEMRGSLSLKQAHDVALAVMAEIEVAFPNAEVFIHQDPEGVEEHHHPRFT
jgi:ferrous-iron efflux pump FieF